MTNPSKTERMDLRRSIGNRVVPTPVARGPAAACLWPHACFECRKSWKLSNAAAGACPECARPLHWMGRAFKAPRKADKDQWTKVRLLWLAGFRFVSHTRGREAEPFPDRPGEVEAFVRRNPEHPFRIER
ncbi:hypothetical protein [Caulobacter endophyticus]|uniref:Uncharacterized protein n=1 Tax=Caulobacter endophyticus TaxID=2172652 RepID=A0A2T9JLK9_9CAUL|nr:hypothetical protein [Caulobacter endophyticus]PVM84556.1 hypothetical protein DDF67_18720 [Caulobacter endophyticus]